MKKYIRIILLILMPIIMISCGSETRGEIVHLQVVDRNGYTKTITNADSINSYNHNDLKGSSPHQKIIRVYDSQKKGVITLYHDSGLLYQYLETESGRAYGEYEEYYTSGKLKIKSTVVEGIADLTDEAKTSWVFDGKSVVYDENGKLMASIPYINGVQEGITEYYYPNGSIKRKVPFIDGKIQGQERGYNPSGDIVLLTNYLEGKKEGESFFKGSAQKGAYEEVYRNGRLVHGKYFDLDGGLFSKIASSTGMKPIFDKGLLIRTEEYKQGVIDGMVTIFRKDRTIETTHVIKDGEKHGEEIFYFSANLGMEPIKKLLITWREGLVHGRVCTWYPNSVLESEKEMCDHKKEGTFLSWYMDSSLMMVEEYHQNKLVNGKYLRKGDNVPISRVIDGVGDAHIYDKEGILLRKISYYNGNPIE